MGSAPVPGLIVNNVRKEYHTPIGRRKILDGISFSLAASEKIAVLGRNGAGKSTLIKLIGGAERPTSGEVTRRFRLSWPIAFGGGFEPEMSGADNIRFIARLYGADEKEVMAFVDGFAELGQQLLVPVRTYSSGMRMRLGFGLMLAIDFDCFLIDEVISVGDQRFHAKCHDELFVKRKNKAMVIVSHDSNIVRQFCNRALVLKSGRGRVFEDVELALKIYQTL